MKHPYFVGLHHAVFIPEVFFKRRVVINSDLGVLKCHPVNEHKDKITMFPVINLHFVFNLVETRDVIN